MLMSNVGGQSSGELGELGELEGEPRVINA
jgi:hypothetical protein